MVTRERFEQGMTWRQQLEKAMLEVRKRMRAETLEPWRQEVVGEIRALLKL